jgi:hypothetical protein
MSSSSLTASRSQPKSLIVSAAVAALLATTGLATAQGVNQGAAKESPAAASPKGDSAVPMNAPAAKGAETLPPDAASKEGKPQHVQVKPEAKDDRRHESRGPVEGFGLDCSDRRYEGNEESDS